MNDTAKTQNVCDGSANTQNVCDDTTNTQNICDDTTNTQNVCDDNAMTHNAYDDGNIPEIDLPDGIQEFQQPKENWITKPSNRFQENSSSTLTKHSQEDANPTSDRLS